MTANDAMPSERRRGVRRTAAPLGASALAVAIALSGCSGSSSSPSAAPATPQPPAAGTPSSSAVDVEASQVITKAAGVMRRMRAYRFVADEQVIATTRLHSHLAGSLVRGQGLAYPQTGRTKANQG